MRYEPEGFAALVVNGGIDLVRPDAVTEAMHALDMLLYLVWILGVARIADGFAI